MLYTTLKSLHVLAIVLWVGGMLFAHAFLRPSLAELDPPQRLRLMRSVLQRFFSAVTVAVAVVLVTGLWMFALAGGRPPWDWSAMAVLGLVMAVVYAVIRWRWFPPMQRAVESQDWPAAADALALIRRAVAFNLGLGLLIAAIAVAF